MSQEQMQRPVTYGDVFDVKGEMATEPITQEDASLMQSVEGIGGGGYNQKGGGAAAAMQAAAARNVRSGLVDGDAHSTAAERGLRFSEVVVNGMAQQTQYVGDLPVSSKTSYVPTLPEAAAMQGITIGEALEEAGVFSGKKVVDSSDARAIQSAEARASGSPMTIQGGVGALAQSAARRNKQGENITMAEVLQDATEKMIADKVATQEDADKVREAECRAGVKDSQAIAVAIQSAADLNADARRCYVEAEERAAGHGSEAEAAAGIAGSEAEKPSEHFHQE